MTAKNLFILDTLVLLGFGIPMLISPQFLADIYLNDSTLSATDVFIFRQYSLFLISNGLLVFTARNAKTSIARKALFLNVIIAGGGASILHTIGIVQGLENAMGWGTVIITAILAVWGLMLYLKEQPNE